MTILALGMQHCQNAAESQLETDLRGQPDCSSSQGSEFPRHHFSWSQRRAGHLCGTKCLEAGLAGRQGVGKSQCDLDIINVSCVLGIE